MKKSKQLFKGMAVMLVMLMAVSLSFPMGVFAAEEPGPAGGDPAGIPQEGGAPADPGDAPKTTHPVYFYGADGGLFYETTVEQDATVSAPPSQPAAPEGMRFVGWFEAGAAEAYAFGSHGVSGEVRLYATFEAIPVEAPPPGPAEQEHTVRFLVNGAGYATDTVLHETLVSLPANPAGAAGEDFVGWYTESGAPFNPYQLITEDLTLIAKFSQSAVIVTYLDTDGSVLEVLEGEVGQAPPAPSRQLGLGMGKKFLHWALSGSQDAFTGTLSGGNITLVPVLADVSIAVFVTNGSEIEPQTGAQGFTASEPAEIPTRDGYTFLGWSHNEDGRGSFDFAGTPINGTVFIYAKWEAAQTNYTLNIWVEKPNVEQPGNPLGAGRANYEPRFTTIRTGTTGETVQLNDSQARIAAAGAPVDVRNLLTYSSFAASEERVLSSNGDTVINVFYTRTVFKYTFDALASSLGGEIFLADGSSVGSRYTIEVKLDQDLTGIWPSRVTIAKEGYSFKNWSDFFGNGAYKVLYSYLSVAFSAPKAMQTDWYYGITEPLRHEVTLTATTVKSPYTETRHYYVELTDAEREVYLALGELAGETVREWTASHSTYGGTRYYKKAMVSPVNNQQASPASQARNWPGRDIEGFETIGSTAGLCRTSHFQQVVLNSGKDYTLYYYMPRKATTLTLVTGSGSIQNPDVRLVAGNGSYTATLKYEQPLADILPADVERSLYRFDGWYLDEAFSKPYSAGTMPGSNLTLYAKYTGTEVEVVYSDGQILSIQTYARGEKLNRHSLSGTVYDGAQIGDVIPGKGIFRGWYYEVGSASTATVAFPLGLSLTRDSYTLRAKLSPQTYTVAFAGHEGGEQAVVYDTQYVTSGNNNTLARSGHTRFAPPAREGYTFKGWTVNEGGIAPNFSTATRILGDITVYAVWEANEVRVSYDANGGALTPEDLQQVVRFGQSLDDAALQLPGADSVAREGYRFLGWFTMAEGGEAFSTAKKLTEDQTLYAHWEADAPGETQTPTPTPDPEPTPDPDPEPTPDPDPEPTPDPDPEPAPEIEPESKPEETSPTAPGTAAGTDGGDDTGTGGTPTGAAPQENAPAGTPEANGNEAEPPAATAETPAIDPVVQTQLANQQGNIVGDILDNNVPLGSTGFLGAWSLLSLLMALGGLAGAVLLLVRLAGRPRQSDEEDKALPQNNQTPDAETPARKKRGVLLKVAAIAMGLLAGVLFLILDDITLPMVFINKWTLWVAVPFAAQLALVVARLVSRRKSNTENAEEAASKTA